MTMHQISNKEWKKVLSLGKFKPEDYPIINEITDKLYSRTNWEEEPKSIEVIKMEKEIVHLKATNIEREMVIASHEKTINFLQAKVFELEQERDGKIKFITKNPDFLEI